MIYLSSRVDKRSNGSDVGLKAIPQMCPTVQQTLCFNKSVWDLGRANLFSIFLGP